MVSFSKKLQAVHVQNLDHILTAVVVVDPHRNLLFPPVAFQVWVQLF